MQRAGSGIELMEMFPDDKLFTVTFFKQNNSNSILKWTRMAGPFFHPCVVKISVAAKMFADFLRNNCSDLSWDRKKSQCFYCKYPGGWHLYSDC